MFLVLLAVAVGGLAVRYRKAGIAVTTIELRNVSRWYGNVVAVNDITMTIGPGVTGLLGPNGAGKSTLLHLISGFLEPSRGAVTVGGDAEPGATRRPTRGWAWSRSARRSTRS